VAKNGVSYSAYTSTDGLTWTPIAGSPGLGIVFGSTALAGLAVTSHAQGTLSTATFDSVQIQ